MNSPHDFVQGKSRTDEDENDDLDVQMTEEEKLEKDRNREEKEKEEEASKKITAFIRTAVFRLKTQNVSKLVLMQLKQEKLDEKMKVFESVQITDARCGVCGVDFREITRYPIVQTDPVTSLNRQISNESESSGILQSSSPPAFPQTGFNSEKQIHTTPNPETLRDNPLSQLLQNALNVLPESAIMKWNQETRKEHEQSQKHKQKITSFLHFKHKYDKEFFDNLEKVRSFIHRHKLETNVVEIHFKDEDYNINSLLREFRGAETKLNTIIKTCDWENAEMKDELDTMFGSYHRIKRYVEDKVKEIKRRSDKQREAAQAKETDDVKNDAELHIEQVVEEPKEKRPKGRGKRKSQRR